MTDRRLQLVLVSCAIALISLSSLAPAVHAQDPQPPSQPPATSAPAQPPAAQTPTDPQKKPDAAKPDDANPKNSRIFLVIPNYATVEKPVKFVPLTKKEKFALGADDAFDPYAFGLAAILAGIAQARNDDAAWHQGWEGYGKRYAAAFGDATIGSFMTTGVFPSLLHEDPRYFRLGTGGFRHRSGYALKRLFVTRTDSDHRQFNFSEFGGNATAAAISLTYHSREERTLANYGTNYLTQISIDVLANQLKEFWPDIRRKLFKK
ncbi:MAG: hypothetical protein ACRD5M_04170 [Candidatus Acidiferrales bacterium]